MLSNLLNTDSLTKYAIDGAKLAGFILAIYITIHLLVAVFAHEHLTVAAPSMVASGLNGIFPTLTVPAPIPVIPVVDNSRAEEIEKARNYLARKASPMAPYAVTIVDAARNCGGDYRTLIAIAEAESGLGRVPYMKYNPYGYLNKKRYSGWESALSDLSCKISREYIAKYGTNFYAFGKRYTGQKDPKVWAGKISRVFNSF